MSDKEWKPPRAVGGVVIVKPDPDRTVSEGGILLGKEKPVCTGIILSVGEWAREHFPELQEGLRVAWTRDILRGFDWDGVWLSSLNVRKTCNVCNHHTGADEIYGLQTL